MKVALVHDWLNGMRGGERVLEALCELYPDAEIFTLLLEPEKVSPRIRGMKIHTSFIQNLPLARRYYRNYLPLFPMAIERFDLTGFDHVISTSHAVAKGCRAPVGAVNVCYCFTPMRYVWFLYEDYFGAGILKKIFLGPLFSYLRRWDVRTSARVHRFLAISKNVAGRIRRIYNREAEIIYPPVDTDYFHPGSGAGDFFLIVSALVPYKKVELAIAVFNRLGLPLKIVGSGPQEVKLRSLAGPNIEFTGWLSDEDLRECYRNCRALIFPGLEDFGIVPLEAQACGRPVIGFGEGGLLETAVPWPGGDGEAPTGIFFTEQTEEALSRAVNLFLENEAAFTSQSIRSHALRFGRERFKNEFKRKIDVIFSSPVKTSGRQKK